MLTSSESIFLSRLCIDSIPGFWMSVIIYRIKIFPLIKTPVSVHHTIIWTGLKNITPIFLSIEMTVYFVFN